MTDPNELEQFVRDHIVAAIEIFRGYLEELTNSEQPFKEKT